MDARRSGAGTCVILVHGSLLGGRYQWTAQAELAARWRLHVVERAGYRDGDEMGEDWSVDAAELRAELEGQPRGAHLVGFSYGAVGAALAAAAVPERVRSLTLIEPSTWSVAFDVAEVQETYDSLIGAVVEFRDQPGEMAEAFLARAGATQTVRKHRLPRALQVGVRAVANGRPSGEAQMPLDALRAAAFPKLVVSGRHSVAFETIADRMADKIGASRAFRPGAGHGVPALGEPVNTLLERFWLQADATHGYS